MANSGSQQLVNPNVGLKLIAGLSVGLLTTLFGLRMPSAIESNSRLMGTVSAVWCAVLACVVRGQIKKDRAS